MDPWGDLHAVTPRGMFTGNRGCLVDDDRNLVRHHNGNLWITCLTSFSDHHHELDQPRHWTPLFFLDEAVALAAGHRPCAYCRRESYNAYRDAIARSDGTGRPPNASEINRRLASERLGRGRGMARANDRITWTAPSNELPDGTVVVVEDDARLLLGSHMKRFGFDGWDKPAPQPSGELTVLTPRTTVAALTAGYRPALHPSATG